jgi:hypothetical protein
VPAGRRCGLIDGVDERPQRSRGFPSSRGGRGGCGCAIVVLTLGIALSLFNTDIGAGASVRVPFTQSNITVAAALGAKTKATEALPDYTRERLGGNQNFINQSQTLTIGPAEAAALFVVGKQTGAPVLDLHLAAR